jgi:arylsulfatase A-like enzyme
MVENPGACPNIFESMKKIYLLILAVTCCLAANAQQNTAGKPNVIIILSDDQGYGDLSVNGNPILQTPAFDRLHDESIRMSNFHVSPLCTPTRGQLMTGMDAMHNKASTVLFGRGRIQRDLVTVPEVFKNNGYSTGIFGKWHLGDTYPDRPMDRGFQKALWFKGWGLLSEAEYDNDYYKTRYMDGLKTVQSSKYCTDLWFDEAMKWMGEMSDKKQPFFTYLSLNVTHGPFYAPEEDYQFYRNKVEDKNTAMFFGMIRNMDTNMARLDKWLEAKGLKENTLVIFMNDNGGTGGIKVFNAGMRDKKASHYDGGHRAFCFMRWPKGQLGTPRTISYPTEIQDLLPTFVDLLGFKQDSKYHFDGQSLKPVLTNASKAPDSRMFVVQYMVGNKPKKFGGCVVMDSWRLVGQNELYDLSKDPGQAQNIADSNPEVLKKMRDYYEQWWSVTMPEAGKIVPVIVGSEKENPVEINSNEWLAESVNTQWAVAQGLGNATGGEWRLLAEKKGKYLIELSRWPFHLNRALTAIGPATAVGGTTLQQGKSLPIDAGTVSLNNVVVSTVKSKPDATKISVEINMEAGENTLQAWFKDKDGKDICGAYYVNIKKLGN